MFIQMRTAIVTEGSSDLVVQRFSKEGIIEQQDGFVDLSVMVKKARRGEEEVIIMIRWESEEKWKKWEKSEAHLAGHRKKAGQPKPDHIIRSESAYYHVKAVKEKAVE
ncbi:antibiotic biosynthesis monooxygenase [Pontibacillus sp. ALD_SL1]|uniref:antibiotic biosynthesis monooxygenase n=1 Tax=Pontibacillus sp. ALD_SL1 TaxID=2777185 RepID=UPI001A958420|nr:antibiotic biosynthesis monooxygenase [Pontibacillus sp. ALD_SL1]QST01047.1 antibiotic biosynthesis monooxygenase [Pontibacillus sp. ALD_SL1]